MADTMKYDPEVHHRRSIRLPAYDYAQAGAYFVTICTKERECIFDDPRIGSAVERTWRYTFSRSRGARTDEFVIMPNHVHGIIWIAAANAVGAQHVRNLAFFHGVEPPAPPSRAVAASAAPLPRVAVAPGSLGAVVRSFKSVTTKRINAIRGTPGAPVWQRNYYEHIVRNEADLQRIRRYIRDNPLMWADDPDNPKNVR